MKVKVWACNFICDGTASIICVEKIIRLDKIWWIIPNGKALWNSLHQKFDQKTWSTDGFVPFVQKIMILNLSIMY